jgi:predicted amidohydrolase YtcJ
MDMREVNNLLIKNADIITLNDKQPSANAVYIQDGRITYVGDTIEAEKRCSSEDLQLDLHGATVVPGLIDSHMHLAHTGLSASSLDLADTSSAEEIVELVYQAAGEIPEGHVIFASRLDDSQLKDNRYPTRLELDRVAPRHPVLLRHRSGHACVLNSLALENVQIPAGTHGMTFTSDGEPNGLLVAQANAFGQAFYKAEVYRQVGVGQIIRLGVAEALKVGLTTIHTLEDADIVPDLLSVLPDLPVKVIIYPQTRDVDLALSFGLGRFGGCGISCLDGDIGSPMTAALFEPYACAPANRGTLYFTDEELKDTVLAAHQNNMQVSMHAIGDRAVAQGLMAIEYAQHVCPRTDARHRIEHWELHNADSARKAVDLGVWVDIQPPFNYYWPHNSEANKKILGEQRIERLDPIASLFNAGIQVAGGSDSPVTPLNPMLDIYCAVNHSNQAQRITPVQALKMYTIQAARIAFEEKDKGSVEVGKLGDLTVLEANPLSADPTTIKDIAVLLTIINGEIRYQHE